MVLFKGGFLLNPYSPVHCKKTKNKNRNKKTLKNNKRKKKKERKQNMQSLTQEKSNYILLFSIVSSRLFSFVCMEACSMLSFAACFFPLTLHCEQLLMLTKTTVAA